MFELDDQNSGGFELEETFKASACIKVVGVGGAGGNAVNRMIEAGVQGVEFIAMNSDMQSLSSNMAPIKLQLGAKLTGGKGVGADPEKGRQAALESENEIIEVLKGADMVFIAAGMGKGTGTGAAPVIAEIARRLGILTIPVVTRPFGKEGPAILKRAEAGLVALSKVTDKSLVLLNDRVLSVAAHVPFTQALRQVDETLMHAIQSISDIITSHGLMNADFNDVRTVMSESGGLFMGVGGADGDEASLRAAEAALTNGFLEGPGLEGAKAMVVLMSVKDETRFTATDQSAILEMVGRSGSKDCNMIPSFAVNPNQVHDIRVTVIGAGISAKKVEEPRRGLEWMDHLDLSAAPKQNGEAQGIRVAPMPSADDLDIPTFMRRRHGEAARSMAPAA